MPPSPSLQELIDIVRTDAGGEDPLLQLSQASRTVADVEVVTDALLGHFVDQCRRSGRSWSEISAALGVSKQAAHKRFSFGAPTAERFTDRARAVLGRSVEEAHLLGHNFVGTEHLLLALFESSDGMAAQLLREMGITRGMAEVQILERIKRGTESLEDDPPFTPRAKQVIREATSEALKLGHNYVGTEHLLLAQFSDADAIASKVLAALGASYEAVRARIIERLQGHGST